MPGEDSYPHTDRAPSNTGVRADTRDTHHSHIWGSVCDSILHMIHPRGQESDDISQGCEDGTTDHHSGGSTGMNGNQQRCGAPIGGFDPGPHAHRSRDLHSPRTDRNLGNGHGDTGHDIPAIIGPSPPGVAILVPNHCLAPSCQEGYDTGVGHQSWPIHGMAQSTHENTARYD